MHGFVLWAIAFIMDGKIALATICMVLAINFKQMALYFAFPFGVYALSLLWERHRGNFVSIGLAIIGLLSVFVATNVVIWSPFVMQGGQDTVNDILYRIFPVRRAIFESKVATFWCMVNHCGIRALKVNSWNNVIQLRMTTGVTLVMCVPSLLLLWLKPSRRQFIFAQIGVCLSFFLFSMQVHEKQILSPLLMFCLSVAMGDFVKLYEIVNSVCLTSMFMLIRGDSADFEA